MHDIDLVPFLSILYTPLREERIIPHVLHPGEEIIHQNFPYRTTKLIRILPEVDITNHVGLKAVVLRCMWQQFEENISQMIKCSEEIGGSCSKSVA